MDINTFTVNGYRKLTETEQAGFAEELIKQNALCMDKIHKKIAKINTLGKDITPGKLRKYISNGDIIPMPDIQHMDGNIKKYKHGEKINEEQETMVKALLNDICKLNIHTSVLSTKMIASNIMSAIKFHNKVQDFPLCLHDIMDTFIILVLHMITDHKDNKNKSYNKNIGEDNKMAEEILFTENNSKALDILTEHLWNGKIPDADELIFTALVLLADGAFLCRNLYLTDDVIDNVADQCGINVIEFDKDLENVLHEQHDGRNNDTDMKNKIKKH